MQVTEAQLWAALIGAALGFFLGALIFGLIFARRARDAHTRGQILESQLANREALDDERRAVLEQAGHQLGQTFDKLANQSLENHSTNFLRLATENLSRHQERASSALEQREKAVARMLEPITDALTKTRVQIEAVEKERHAAFGGVGEQLKLMGEAQRLLQQETANLVGALKRPEVRGRWGEITLRRVVELAGMVAHCDFEEQVHRTDGDTVARPDMVVRLPEKRSMVVDSKTPLDAYLAAVEATTDDTRKVQLERHARQIRERIRELAGKKYWQQFTSSPEFVVLFLPGDQFLSSALEISPDILDDALRQKVIVATPASLMALLKTVAYGWRQLELNDNALLIRDLAESLYHRLATFTTHLARVGGSLEQSVNAYNAAVGSLERQVLPGARKFTELGVSKKKDIASLTPLDASTRTPNDGDAGAAAARDTDPDNTPATAPARRAPQAAPTQESD